MPKRTLTTVVASAARRPLSRHMIPWYVRHYGIDPGEAELPLERYESLAAFFCRRLKRSARPVDLVGVISPVDGMVSAFGSLVADRMIQAKGHDYSIVALLGDADMARRFAGGHYIAIYLSPRDYHRIHMPVTGRVIGWQYIPGTLYPVNRLGVQCIPGLYASNERLVTYVMMKLGLIAVVKIGAAIVGSIRTSYGPQYRSPRQRYRAGVLTGQNDLALERGEELGHFEFGSTVILLFEPGIVERWLVQTGESVRMGQRIAELFCQE
ncbi:MAG: archaetidylserine decarboxylase [Alicyclobacillus sp.]|nr:archaetidylserine decarboxylase [Alicyclobacillus sp.]